MSDGEKKPVVRPTTKIMSFVGVIKSFDPSTDDIQIWIQTFRSFLIAEGLDVNTKEERCRAVLLSTLGLPTVFTLMSLIAPDESDTRTLAELLQLLTDHFKPTPKAIAERFRFMSRKQTSDESVAQYLAELRKLASRCKFATDLDMRLRDQFVFWSRKCSNAEKTFHKTRWCLPCRCGCHRLSTGIVRGEHQHC